MSAVTNFTAEDAEEYTQSLSQIFAGSYRQILWAKQRGIPQALGLTTEEWVTERLGGYVRMQIPDRKKAVAELSKEGLSNRKIAEVLGVSDETINRDVRATSVAAGDGNTQISESSAATDVAPDLEAETKTKTRKQRDQTAAAKREDRERREAQVVEIAAPDIRQGSLSEALADVRTLATLLLGLIAIATKGEATFDLPVGARDPLGYALVAFAVAASLSILTNIPRRGDEASVGGLRKFITERQNDTEQVALYEVAKNRLIVLESARTIDRFKGYALVLAMVAETVALVFLAWAMVEII